MQPSQHVQNKLAPTHACLHANIHIHIHTRTRAAAHPIALVRFLARSKTARAPQICVTSNLPLVMLFISAAVSTIIPSAEFLSFLFLYLLCFLYRSAPSSFFQDGELRLCVSETGGVRGRAPSARSTAKHPSQNNNNNMDEAHCCCCCCALTSLPPHELLP